MGSVKEFCYASRNDTNAATIRRNKIKVFENDGKYNFVDENNVFVGYDSGQSCCENFGYFFTDKMPEPDITADKTETTIEFDQSKYVFDPSFIERINGGSFDEGGIAIFKLVNKDKRKKKDIIYLCLYNYHNGYYGHGFEMKIGEETTREGCI